MAAQSPDTTEVELPKFYEFIPSILDYLSDRTLAPIKKFIAL